MIFKKKPNIFFDTLVQSAQNLKDAAYLFQEQIYDLKNADYYAENIKLLEDKGDELTHKIIHALNKTFITPLEREDILGMALELDNVVDGIEASSDRMSLFKIREADDYTKLFVRLICSGADEIIVAIDFLAQKKLNDMYRHIYRLNQLENEGDQLYREALVNLFENYSDAILVLKKKEIYDMLEQVLDSCEDLANILEALIMRNT